MAGRRQDEIWVEGLDRLYANMNLVLEDVNREAMTGLKKAGMGIVGEAQRNLRTSGKDGGTSNTTGRLSQSGRTQVKDDGTLDVGFFSQDGGKAYASYLEYGRRRGKWPPRDAIEEWLRIKTSVGRGMKSAFNSASAFLRRDPDAYRRSLAFLIARAIGEHGTRPHPFFAPAVKKYSKEVSKVISGALARVINKDRTNG